MVIKMIWFDHRIGPTWFSNICVLSCSGERSWVCMSSAWYDDDDDDVGGDDDDLDDDEDHDDNDDVDEVDDLYDEKGETR